MQNAKVRHRGATRPSPLRGRGVGGLFPEGANDFRRKCSEYTGPARCPLHRTTPAAGVATAGAR